MGRSTPRKSRNAPALELLEDRRLLSFSGLASAWDASVPMVADYAGLAPPVWGPIAAGAEQSPGPTDRAVGTFENSETIETFHQSGPSLANPDPVVGSFAPFQQSAPTIAAPGLADMGRWSSESTSATSNEGSSPCPMTTTLALSQFDTDSSASWAVAPQAAGSSTNLVAPSPQANQPAESSSQMASGSLPPSMSSAKTTTGTESVETPDLPSAMLPPTNLTSALSARAAFPEPPPRQTSFVVPAAPHAETGSADASEGAAHAAATDAMPALIGGVGAGSDPSAMDATRGSVPVVSANGLGSLASQARVSLDPGPAKGSGEGRAVSEGPGSQPLGSGMAESPESTPDLAPVEVGEPTDTPPPRLAELIVDLLPTGRATFEGIVDRILEPFDGLSVTMSGWDASIGLLAASLTVAAAVLAVEVTLRSRRDRQVDGIDEEGGTLVDFPGLPSLGRETF